MFGIGVPELLIILFIVLLLFGARKLPGLANSLGSSVSEFKKGLKGAPDPDRDEKASEKVSEKVIDGRTASTGEPVPKQKTDAKS
jgi:sec-independent protein translocase protein TatA